MQRAIKVQSPPSWTHKFTLRRRRSSAAMPVLGKCSSRATICRTPGNLGTCSDRVYLSCPRCARERTRSVRPVAMSRRACTSGGLQSPRMAPEASRFGYVVDAARFDVSCLVPTLPFSSSHAGRLAGRRRPPLYCRTHEPNPTPQDLSMSASFTWMTLGLVAALALQTRVAAAQDAADSRRPGPGVHRRPRSATSARWRSPPVSPGGTPTPPARTRTSPPRKRPRTSSTQALSDPDAVRRAEGAAATATLADPIVARADRRAVPRLPRKAGPAGAAATRSPRRPTPSRRRSTSIAPRSAIAR